MIKGVVFDLDHTLFDRYATLRAVLPEMYKRMRESIADDLTQDMFIEKLIAVEKQYIYYGWDYTGEKLVEAGVFKAGTIGSDIWKCLFTYCWPIAAVKYPFCEPALVRLREMGLKLGIVTNGEHKLQQNKLRLLNFEKLFDEIVISGDIGAQKPDTKPFEVISKKLNIPPSELLYVGDNPLNDVKGSRDAGFVPVWVKTIGNWCFEEIEPAEYAVDTVAEIPKIVNKINKWAD